MYFILRIRALHQVFREQRRGNMAYMPPEILNIKRNDVLDYSKADRWSITLIALDILFGHLARGNPFYPLRGGKRHVIKGMLTHIQLSIIW